MTRGVAPGMLARTLKPAKGIAILAFGAPITRHQPLLDAALLRAADVRETAGIIVVCPTPLIVARALGLAGYRTAVLARSPLDAAFAAEIVELGGVPVVDGTQLDAIELARTIGAERVILYTDSQGVMSANPSSVSDAVSVRYVSHEELMELADHGANPVSADAANAASTHDVTYEVRSVVDNEGTVIRGNDYEDRFTPISSITVSSGYALYSMGAKNIGATVWTKLQLRILEEIAAAGISIEMFQSFSLGLRFLAPADQLETFKTLAQSHKLAFHVVEGCAKLCIVGTGVRGTAGVFYRGFSTLVEREIPLLHWSDSNVTISFVVTETVARLSETLLHEALAPGSDITVGAAISFDADFGLVRINGREIRLGTRQAQLLGYLLENAGRVVEAEELARHLFGKDTKDELAAVRVHLHNLRKKIEDRPETPRYIVTVPDQGYVFVR